MDPTMPESSESWNRLAAVAGDEEAAARRKLPDPPEPGRLRPFMLVCLLAFSGVAAWWSVREDGGPTLAQTTAGRRAALALAGTRLEAYERENHRFPDNLGQAMPLDLGITYTRIGGGAVLEATLPDGQSVRREVKGSS